MNLRNLEAVQEASHVQAALAWPLHQMQGHPGYMGHPGMYGGYGHHGYGHPGMGPGYPGMGPGFAAASMDKVFSSHLIAGRPTIMCTGVAPMVCVPCGIQVCDGVSTSITFA